MLETVIFVVIISLLETISSGIGGLLGAVIQTNTKDIQAMLYEITAGIMTGIVCFDMLPESYNITNVFVTTLTTLLGIFFIHMVDNHTQIISFSKQDKKFSFSTYIIIFAMSLHNVTEGIAMGASYSYDFALSLSIIIAMFLHNIPEGMIVSISAKEKNNSVKDLVKYASLVGMPTGIGAFIGKIIGDTSVILVGASLSFSAGAMLYIVACELLPKAKKACNNKRVYLTYAIGIIFAKFI